MVYGSPLFATTHISLIIDAEQQRINTKVIHSASIFDAIAETGLQLYKFGKIASMPEQGKSDFLEYVKQNQSIKAHSLILVDIGMSFKNALNKLETEVKNKKIKIDKIIVCSKIGTDESEIIYSKIKDLKDKEIHAPFCFIIPSELHFLEKEGVERFEKSKNH